MSCGNVENDEVSMVDVLDEDNELEAEANAVLGDSDDQNCTYSKGYVARQALYACLTCTPAAPEIEHAGICLACSLTCHDNHELVELYTKRDFRCDCGNKKFDTFQCKLFKDKADSNLLNKYNQNFKGLYCSCKRPYPDPEDEIEDEMIQCISCEDWFHSRHLHNLPPADGEYSEMICDDCMADKLTFLQVYVQYSVPSQEVCKIKKSEDDVVVDVENVKQENGVVGQIDQKQEKSIEGNSTPLVEESTSTDDDKIEEKADKRKLPAEILADVGESSSKKVCKDENAGVDCLYKKLQSTTTSGHKGCTFWKSGWRSQLCICENCKQMYSDKEASFLLDDNDTIVAYEARGQTHRGQRRSSYDSGLDALNNLNRVQQMEILHGYNDLKTELKTYLADFAKEGKIVKEEDIRNFFQTLKNKKNTSAGNFQHFCR